MERQVIARWESRRGKDWVELYKDQWGYGYAANGSGGFFGRVSETRALEEMERRIFIGMYASQTKPMKKVV